MGQLQLLGPAQKLNATSAEAAGQAAPALPGDPGGPGFKRSAIMYVVWLKFLTGSVASVVWVLSSQTCFVVVGVLLLMLTE